ncbi:MAG: carboxypeptidase regulatory-like domain-containing protein [Chitinophagales bacterium]|nr:carboxypeptidase regulatory-like domain-containing protein [Chitinophagales bacterium]MDW8428002.1 carboxypeptidase regulatory-like domain-containing protein [Chitinophagales bacterium]
MKKIFLLAGLVMACGHVWAQTGELQGRVYDEATGEGIPFAAVVLEQQGLQRYVGQTDDDGRYTIKPIVPGTYDLRVQYLGYQPVILSGVKVIAEQIAFQDVPMKASATLLPEVKVVTDRLIDPGKTATGSTFDKTEIMHLATRNTNNTASLTAGVFQRDDNQGLNIAGARSNATQYFVDGIKMRGSVNLPQSSIEQLSVITGGLPAKYGDMLGGLVTITTRGPSQQYHGGIEYVTSQFLDAFGYNLASFNLSGPLFTRYKGTDSARSRMGFFVSGEWEHYRDASARAIPIYQVKPEVLKYLQENPLTPSPTGSGFVPTSAFITKEDLFTQKYLPNNASNSYRFAGKLDFQLSDYMNLTLGSNFSIGRSINWDYNSLLFAVETANEYFNANVYRGFVRFTQRFPTSLERDKESIFQNAYYSLQFDYTKEYERLGDPEHEFNAFNYGYVGRFETLRRPVYFYGKDSATNLTGWLLFGYLDTLVKYTPGTLNPLLSNYTTKYFELAPGPTGYYRSIYDIANGGGILNGSLPVSTMTVYSMFLNTGYPTSSFGLRNNDQYHVALNASVDIMRRGKGEKGKHAVEFGFEYEQRVDRRYIVFPVGLWGLARQLTNSHIQNLDTKNPRPVYDEFGVYLDTVNYDRLFLASEQAYFDKSLRQRLGLNPSGLDFIDIDAIDPSLLSLDLFSPDELLNNGSNYYFAYGYDYLGNVLKSQPSLEDYFSQRDANGNLTRNQPAYRPNYAAAYVQDRFNFRDLVFNIGVRVDRFDNNQFVLKDKYSLYPIRTVAEVTDLGPHPSNIPSNAYVYVDDIQQPTTITGYRVGDTWYNAQGTEINDPKVIAQATTTGLISPYLVNNDLNSLELTPASFKDYTPQITVMPRIAFSFPISDEALFFAHYDVLTQRPSGTDSRSVALATMFQYYFFRQLQGTVFANPDLKPEKTIDYQVGFKQALGNTSALTISGTYRELKDLIQVANIAYAYPLDYITYTNTDFGTVKSLAFTYELRRIRNVKLDANYTLQFAAGTGSSATSGIRLVGSGLPNLRTIVPFSYDQRHNIAIAVDYRFGEGRNYNGPTWGKAGIPYLANTGLNVILRAGSGTPYSKQTSPTPTALFGVATQTSLDGSVNGSRLPWSFKVDAKLDKDFRVSQTKDLYLNIYLLAQNLFNTANVLTVYAFTGNPDDDGYLSSATGQQAVAAQINPETFELLYDIKQNRPFHYSLARRLQLGAIFNF